MGTFVLNITEDKRATFIVGSNPEMGSIHKKKCMEKGVTMTELVKAMHKRFSIFEEETKEIQKENKAKKVIAIYDRIDRYLLSEEDDEFIYEMYSRVRNYLWDSVYWEEPEFLPLF